MTVQSVGSRDRQTESPHVSLNRVTLYDCFEDETKNTPKTAQYLAVLNYCYYWRCFRPFEDYDHRISYTPLLPQSLPLRLLWGITTVLYFVHITGMRFKPVSLVLSFNHRVSSSG